MMVSARGIVRGVDVKVRGVGVIVRGIVRGVGVIVRGVGVIVRGFFNVSSGDSNRFFGHATSHSHLFSTACGNRMRNSCTRTLSLADLALKCRETACNVDRYNWMC
jgi:hypothetical protein